MFMYVQMYIHIFCHGWYGWSLSSVQVSKLNHVNALREWSCLACLGLSIYLLQFISEY